MKKCCWLYANEKLSVYSACFIGKTVNELIEDFNAEVGMKNQDQDRVYYHEALIHAIQEKGIDVSAVLKNGEIRFDHRVRFDAENRELIIEK